MSHRSPTLLVEIWDEDRWRASRIEYEALLAQSQADRLFLSWEWLTLWWDSLDPRCDGDALRIYAVRDGDQLVGVMPVFRNLAVRRGMRYQAANLLGGCVRQGRGVFSEYLDVVAMPGMESLVRRACLSRLLSTERYCEISVATTPAYQDWDAAFRGLGRWRGAYVRTIDAMTSYQADLSAGFDAYLSTLSSNARRSVFNLRKRLQAHGEVRLELVPTEKRVKGIEELNELHRQRWGEPAFGPMTSRMQIELMKAWKASDRIQMSKLIVGGRTVSMLYDIRIGAVQYNIQMGFDPTFDASLSLGLLHLGFAMENAAVEGVVTYDFLAGRGRVSDYKKRIASRSRPIASVQCFHGPLLSTAFRVHGCLWRFVRGVRSALVPTAVSKPQKSE